MDLQIFLDLISTVGFPIAVSIALAWFVYKIYKQSEKREEILMAEIKENRETNTKAIETISLYAERLTHIEGSVEEIQMDIGLIKEKL